MNLTSLCIVYLPKIKRLVAFFCNSYHHNYQQLHINIAETILHLAEERGRDKTICPSEVARHMFPNNWRSSMKQIRKIAFDLRDKGKVAILQKGNELDGKEAIGPIRIRIV